MWKWPINDWSTRWFIISYSTFLSYYSIEGTRSKRIKYILACICIVNSSCVAWLNWCEKRTTKLKWTFWCKYNSTISTFYLRVSTSSILKDKSKVVEYSTFISSNRIFKLSFIFDFNSIENVWCSTLQAKH